MVHGAAIYLYLKLNEPSFKSVNRMEFNIICIQQFMTSHLHTILRVAYKDECLFIIDVAIPQTKRENIAGGSNRREEGCREGGTDEQMKEGMIKGSG